MMTTFSGSARTPPDRNRDRLVQVRRRRGQLDAVVVLARRVDVADALADAADDEVRRVRRRLRSTDRGARRLPEPEAPDLRQDAGQGLQMGLRQRPQDSHPNPSPDQHEW